MGQYKEEMEKEVATHSGEWQQLILAWRIPWTEELGGPQSLDGKRVRHDLVTGQQQKNEEEIYTCLTLMFKCLSFQDN